MSNPTFAPHIYLAEIPATENEFKLAVAILIPSNCFIEYPSTLAQPEGDESTRICEIRIMDGDHAAGWCQIFFEISNDLGNQRKQGSEMAIEIQVLDFRSSQPQEEDLGHITVLYENADSGGDVSSSILPHLYLSEPQSEENEDRDSFKEYLVSVYFGETSMNFDYSGGDELSGDPGSDERVLTLDLGGAAGTLQRGYVNLPNDTRDDPPKIELDSDNDNQEFEVQVFDNSSGERVPKGKTRLLTKDSDDKDIKGLAS